MDGVGIPRQCREMFIDSVELKRQRPRVGVVVHQQVFDRRQSHIAAVPAAVCDQTLAGTKHEVEYGLGDVVRRRIDERRLDDPQQEHRPFEAATEVEESPAWSAHHAFHDQPRQCREVDHDPVEALRDEERIAAIGRRGKNRSFGVEAVEHSPSCGGEEFADATGVGRDGGEGCSPPHRSGRRVPQQFPRPRSRGRRIGIGVGSAGHPPLTARNAAMACASQGEFSNVDRYPCGR